MVEALWARYRVEEEIGAGGMAAVYRARDLRHGRDVALKILLGAPGDSAARERFRREIRTVASLSHPHILPLHDSGEVDDAVYFVMPLVEGPTLRDALASGPLPPDRVRELGLQLAGALRHAHARGVVHRDVKPENVLLVDGQAVLADFGIATALAATAGGPRLTAAGRSVGTPLYMSPEQAAGRPDVDGRSDLYSLGCVLFEAVSGHAPFDARTVASLLAQKGRWSGDSGVLAEAPSDLRDAILACLAPSPEQRPADAGELARRLGRGRPGRSRAARSALVALAVVAASVLGVLAFQRARGPRLVENRVLVATLENRTGDPGLDGLAALATDWIAQGLERTGKVSVVPPVTVRQAEAWLADQAREGKATDPVQMLARETGAARIIHGSLDASGDSLSMQLQVSDGAGGTLRLALDPILGSREHADALVGEARSRIMSAMAAGADPAAPSLGSRPPRYDSYRRFDEGLRLYAASRYSEALPEFQGAVALDSTFVQAILYEALDASNLGDFAREDSLLQRVAGHREDLTPYETAWVDYRRALVAGDPGEALRSIRRAAAEAPYSKASYNHAVVAMEQGRYQEALQALKVLDADRGPMRGVVAYLPTLAAVEHLRGDHRAELRAAREARTRYPDHPWTAVTYMAARAGSGRSDDAADSLRAFLPRAPREGRWRPLAATRQMVDEIREHGGTGWRRLAEEALERYGPPAGAAPDLASAELLVRLGRWGEAERIAGAVLRADSGDVRALTLVGASAAAAGRDDLARSMAGRLAGMANAAPPGIPCTERRSCG